MAVKFPHKAPKGYYYEQEPFKKNITAIWLCTNREFDYNLGKPTKCIWGFYNQKTEKYYAPVNSKTVGSAVTQTRPWTAMQIKQTILEQCFS